MKTKNIKSVLTSLLALSLIVASSLGLQMNSGFAEGVSGSYYPTLSCTIANLNGNSLTAYQNRNNEFTRDDTYPRLVTNGNQIRVRFWAYDSEGVSSINIKLIKVLEKNQLISWHQPDCQELIYNNDFSVQNDKTKEHIFNITAPGTYAVLATTKVNGRETKKARFFLYGPGTVVGGDFNYRFDRPPQGQALYCTLYDLGDTGIESVSLYVTKPGAPTILSNTGLTITQDPTFKQRYKVFGYANRSQLQNVPGQYQSYLLTLSKKSSDISSIYFPPYN